MGADIRQNINHRLAEGIVRMHGTMGGHVSLRQEDNWRIEVDQQWVRVHV
jgi:hypothetical protein